MALDYHLITFLVAFFAVLGAAIVFAIPLCVVLLIHLIKKDGVRHFAVPVAPVALKLRAISLPLLFFAILTRVSASHHCSSRQQEHGRY